MTLKDELTPLEYERAGLLFLGLTFKQISKVIGSTEGNVKRAFSRMYEKTDTADYLELAVRYAHELMAGRYKPREEWGPELADSDMAH